MPNAQISLSSISMCPSPSAATVTFQTMPSSPENMPTNNHSFNSPTLNYCHPPPIDPFLDERFISDMSMENDKKDEHEISTTTPGAVLNNTPLPSFFEVQWSSVRVCDPLLAFKQPTSPKDSDDLLKPDFQPKSIALLSSPSPSSLESNIQTDLLMENNAAYQPEEISTELWPM